MRKFIETIFGVCVFVMIGESRESLDKLLKDRFNDNIIEEDYGDCDGLTITTQDPKTNLEYYVMWIYDAKRLDIIVHEVFHLVSDVFDKRGVDYVPSTDNEVYAYYIQYWFNKIHSYSVEIQTNSMKNDK